MRSWAKLPVVAVVAIGVVIVAGGRWSHPRSIPAQAALVPPVSAASLAGRASSVELFTYTRRVADVEPLGESVWVATSGGLVELERETGDFVRLYSTLDGFPPSPASDLLGVDGRLWMAGKAGLVSFEPAGTQFSIVDPHAVTRLEHQPQHDALWAFGRGRVTRVDLETQQAHSRPFRDCPAIRLSGDELWTVHTGDLPWVAVRCVSFLGDGETRQSRLPVPNKPPSGAFLCPAGDRLWAMVEGTQTVHRALFAVDRATGEVSSYNAEAGLPGDYPRILEAHGDDLWAACSAEYYGQGWQRYFGGGLARFNAETQAWQRHLSISGSRRDEPTAMKTIDGDLWVATQGYDDTREMVVGFGMGRYTHKAPVVKHLALCRWQPRSETWEVHRFPAEHDYAAIVDFHPTPTDFWLLIDRTNLERDGALWFVPPEKGGVWLASCPRAGGDLQWHFQVAERRPSRTWPRLVKGVYVIDDTIWVCHERLSKRFDPATRTWQDVEWPVPLPVTGVQAATALRGEVWLGTERGDVLRLDGTGRQFALQARVQTFEPHQAPDRELVAPVNCLTVPRRGTLWVACGSSHMSPATRPLRGASAPPIWSAPSSLVRLADGAVTVPHAAPWSWAVRLPGDRADARLVAPDETRELTRGGIGFNAFGWWRGMCPGEPGLACVLPEKDRAWIGTLGDGLYCLEDDKWERLGPLVQQKPLKRNENPYPECRPDDLVLALARAGDALYVATYGGLYRYEPRTGMWRSIGPPQFVPSLMDKTPRFDEYGSAWGRAGSSFLVELRGELWLPGRIAQRNSGAGLYRLPRGADEVEPVPVDALPTCATAHRGYLWIGTEKGLLRIHPRTLEQLWLTEEGGLHGLPVTALAADRETLWVASSEAVMRITAEEFDQRASVAAHD